MPDEASLTQAITGVVDPDALHLAWTGFSQALAARLQADWWATYEQLAPQGSYRFDPPEMGRRTLRNGCLAYLAELETELASAAA